MFWRTTATRGMVKNTRSPDLSDHGTMKSASFAPATAAHHAFGPLGTFQCFVQCGHGGRHILGVVVLPGADCPEPDREQTFGAQQPAQTGGIDAGAFQHPAHALNAGHGQHEAKPRIKRHRAYQGERALAVELEHIEAAHQNVEQTVAVRGVGVRVGANQRGLIGHTTEPEHDGLS